MKKTKLSDLIKGTITYWDDEKNDFIFKKPELNDINFVNVINDKDLYEKLIKVTKQSNGQLKDEKVLSIEEYIYEVLKIVTDVDMDLTIDEFKNKYNSCGILFLKFSRKVISYCTEQMQELNEITKDSIKMLNLSKQSMKDNLKIIEKQWNEEKDTKKKQQLFVELSKLKQQLNK